MNTSHKASSFARGASQPAGPTNTAVKTCVLVFSAGLFLTAATAASAQARHRITTNTAPAPLPSPVTRMPPPVMRFNQLVEELKLSDEQKTKFQAATAEQSAALRELVSDKSLSTEERTARTKAIAEKAKAAVNAILTGEQKKKYAEIMARPARSTATTTRPGETVSKGP